MRQDGADEEGLTASTIAKEALGMGLGLGLHTAYYGGKLAYHGIRAGKHLIDALNERRETSEGGEEEPHVGRIMRRGASRSPINNRESTRERSRSRDASADTSRGSRDTDVRQDCADEQPNRSNDAIRLLRRGASRNRSSTPPKKGKRCLCHLVSCVL